MTFHPCFLSKSPGLGTHICQSFSPSIHTHTHTRCWWLERPWKSFSSETCLLSRHIMSYLLCYMTDLGQCHFSPVILYLHALYQFNYFNGLLSFRDLVLWTIYLHASPNVQKVKTCKMRLRFMWFPLFIISPLLLTFSIKRGRYICAFACKWFVSLCLSLFYSERSVTVAAAH